MQIILPRLLALIAIAFPHSLDLFQTSIIFISHDLSLVSHIADRVLVMNRGCVVEQGPTAQVFTRAESGHTRYLIDTRMQLITRLRQMTSPAHAA